MKIKKYSFARLTSRFPDATDVADMLRYDIAFQSVSDPTLVVFPIFHTGAGNLGGKITGDRWRSFGITVTPITDDNIVEDLKFGMNPDDFVTFRHVAPDFKTLVKFTLTQYRDAKNQLELDRKQN